MIKKELEHNESGFKHCVLILDNVIKGCHVFFDMESLLEKIAEHLILFEAILVST